MIVDSSSSGESGRAQDGVPGGFGVVAAPGRGGPPEGAVGELVDLPPGVLLEPVVVAALRAAVTQARPAARLVRRVVLEVALGGGPPADRAGAGGVPDLGQVPQLDPGIVAAGLVPVVAGLGGQGVEGDDQVRPVPGGAQPPGAVAAGRPVPAGRGEGEPGGPARRAALACGSWVRAGRSRARRRGRARRSRSRTRSSSGWARRRRPGRGPARGRPGRARRARRAGPARPVTVASGTVRVTRPANPAGRRAGAGPARACAGAAILAVRPRPGRGRESLPRSRSRKARARSSSMPPSSPACAARSPRR